MEIFYYVYLFVIGTLFGSFSSVIISRLKNHKSGIIAGRSECPKCKHKLGIKDLFPIFSYLSTMGKCRYCHKKISITYPILEIVCGLLFVLTSYFLVDFNLILALNTFEIIKLLFFLIFSFLSFIYIVYDILYLEIPDSILAILIGMTFIGLGVQTILPNYDLFAHLHSSISFGVLQNSLIISSGLIIIGIYYAIMFLGLEEVLDFFLYTLSILILVGIKYGLKIDLENTIIGSSIIAMVIIYGFLFLQILLSKGRALGAGDLRIGILMGLIAGINFSFSAIFITYIVGSIFGIIFIIYTKIKNYKLAQKKFSNIIRKIVGIEPKVDKVDTTIPFGPFLGVGIFAIIFFHTYIAKLLETYL